MTPTSLRNQGSPLLNYYSALVNLTMAYLVESVREGRRVRQQIVRALGRKDALLESGELDRLIAFLARHSERAMILSDMEAGRIACTRIGGPFMARQSG